MRRWLLGTIVLFSLVGCVPSEEEIQAEFDAFTASRKSCEQAEDCTVVTPGCPLGCYAVVAKEHAAAVEKKAHELIEDYERGGQTCDYSCTALPEPRCNDGECE